MGNQEITQGSAFVDPPECHRCFPAHLSLRNRRRSEGKAKAERRMIEELSKSNRRTIEHQSKRGSIFIIHNAKILKTGGTDKRNPLAFCHLHYIALCCLYRFTIHTIFHPFSHMIRIDVFIEISTSCFVIDIHLRCHALYIIRTKLIIKCLE